MDRRTLSVQRSVRVAPFFFFFLCILRINVVNMKNSAIVEYNFLNIFTVVKRAKNNRDRCMKEIERDFKKSIP